MELFKSGLKTVLGGQSSSSGGTSDGPSGAETVERLLERVQTSTLLDDRRDACRALRSLSKKYRVEVGAQGLDALINVLSLDRSDTEIVAYTLECLLNVTSPELLDDEDPKMQHVGQQFTEIISKKSENVAVLLSILEEYDFRIRLPVIRLMTNLLINRPKDIQEILLVSPMGTSKIMDLLSDSREVVRNDAILLLIAMTKSNANIQKIIAFENGFDRILQIIHDEGYSDGGPVVEDCLQLFLNLLRSNTSNLTFFREGSYIKRLLPFFSLPDDEFGWPTQKVSNVFHMLQIVRTLVTPLNPSHVTHSCQKSLKACGILECLCNMLMASGVPAETLTEAIVTVGEAIRGNLENQEFFSSVVAPSDPPRPVLVILLMTLVNDRQPLSLRCAVLYCIQSYLYKNEKSQDDIVKTLLPSSSETSNQSVTAGQMLCGGLFSKDMTSNWFSSIALGHSLVGNSVQKESLLKVQLATKANSPPITLMNHILQSLIQGAKPQVKIGFLQFLSIWLESSSIAITQFLSNGNAVPYLITQITSSDSEDKEILVHGLSAFVLGLCLYFNPNTIPSFTKDNLVQLITNRIGMETLTDGLSNIAKSEFYLHSLKHPQVLAKHSSDLVFDQSFCLLFKKYESLILLQLTDPETVPIQADSSRDINKTGHMVSNHQSPNEVINRYKEVIRTQDEAIENCKREIMGLTNMNLEYKGKVEEMLGEVIQLKSQLALAQAQRETFGAGQVRQVPEDQHHAIVAQKNQQIHELEMKLAHLEGNYGLVASAKNPMQEELIGKLEEENKVLVDEMEKMKKDQEELLELLSEQDGKLSEYRSRLRQLGVQVEEEDPEDDLDIVNMPTSAEVYQDAGHEENFLQ